MSARVLVTGATGFIGGVLCEQLASAGYLVRAALRRERDVPSSIAETRIVGDIGGGTDWSAALEGVDYIVHTAARVHVLHDDRTNAGMYAETNAIGTQRLAVDAAKARVRRFVYLSSIKVNGEETIERPYTATDEAQPVDSYGASKWQAERHLRRVATEHSLEFAIVRPPLVYGPGVRANFLRLLRWVDKERPLPLGAVRNRRSLVSVWNLTDMIGALLRHPDGGTGRVWMVSDGQDLSTTELIQRMAVAMGKRARLLPIPVSMLHVAGHLLGRSAEIARLCGSLCVDIAPARARLGWCPPVSVDEGLARTAVWYTESARG